MRQAACFRNPSFAGLVVIAGSLNPIPSRTRPLNSPAPMVLSLKAWKSRSLPGLPRTDNLLVTIEFAKAAADFFRGGFFHVPTGHRYFKGRRGSLRGGLFHQARCSSLMVLPHV